MKSCIPPDLQAQSEAAAQRRDDALDRQIRLSAGAVPLGDPFESEMRSLIDADKRVVSLLQKKRGTR